MKMGFYKPYVAATECSAFTGYVFILVQTSITPKKIIEIHNP